MSSFISYKFRSYKDFSTLGFEGDALTLWEIKYEIIHTRRMNSRDFDLIFYDADNGERIEDEGIRIEKNSRLIVERIPLHMSTNRGSLEFNKKMGSTVKQPPDNYVCYRCGEKGHFIQHCSKAEEGIYEGPANKVSAGIPKEVGGDVPRLKEWEKQRNAQKYKNVPDDVKCVECKGILENPVYASCMHLFCMSCLRIDERCGRCRKTIIFYKKDPELTRRIEEYRKDNDVK